PTTSRRSKPDPSPGSNAGGRITWVRGDERPGPRQLIGVLELRRRPVPRRLRRADAGRWPVSRAPGAAGLGGQGVTRRPVVEPGARREPQGGHDPQRVVRRSGAGARRPPDRPRPRGAGPAGAADDDRGGRRAAGVSADSREISMTNADLLESFSTLS